jgi:RNA polymerase sigma-70 factor, ECF subfamily
MSLTFAPQKFTSRLPPAVELFERYGAMVYRRCFELLGTEDLAKDAVQAVFLRVVERRGTYRGESSPLTWLYGIATLLSLQQLRDRARREAKLAAEAPGRASDHKPSLDDRLTVAALLDGEDDDVRRMVFLRHVDGMTVEEVAEAVGFSRKTVTKKLQRFLETARLQLAPGSGEDP